MGRLLFEISLRIYGYLMRASRGIKDTGTKGTALAKRASHAVARNVLAGVLGTVAIFKEELVAAKQYIHSEARIWLARKWLEQVFGAVTEQELDELAYEMRNSKESVTVAFKATLQKFTNQAFDASIQRAERAVNEADLSSLQTIAALHNVTPPTELSDETKRSVMGAIRRALEKVRDEGKAQLRTKTNELAASMAKHERDVKEAIAKRKAELKAQAHLEKAGVTAQVLTSLRKRSDSQLAKMLENLKEGDNQHQWTKKQIEAVIKEREQKRANNVLNNQ